MHSRTPGIRPKKPPVRLVFLLATIAAIIAASSGALSTHASSMKPAIETKSNIGTVIATPMKLGIYYWDVEKKAGGKIRCTGACLKQWPPVYVTGAVPKHVTGVMRAERFAVWAPTDCLNDRRPPLTGTGCR